MGKRSEGGQGAGGEAGTERRKVFRSLSGLPIPSYREPQDMAGIDYETAIGRPGSYPFTRGVFPTMYRGRLWTMRQYAGFGTAEETNRRFHYLLGQGQTGLSVAFDLPTQMGLDSDDARAQGEVGKVGVAIDSLADMERLTEGIPLGQVSTSMTINAPAAILLLMYQAVAERQGIEPHDLRGTIQNDILKEYAARGTYIFPPAPSLRLVTDTFAYCKDVLPKWNPISVSGYHIREAGSTAPQEIAFTLANGLAYVRAAKKAGLEVDEFAPRLSFFFNAHIDLFEEVAKYRAARRIWARLIRAEGATDPKSMMLRFHAQTAGSALTAQQPLVNTARVTVQGLAAVLGGCQSLHTNAYDEALALPTEDSALLALRTQQVLAHETGVADSIDPLAGSYHVEALTSELERQALELLERVENLGGAVRAVETGFVQREIEESAYRDQLAIEHKERLVVGVNAFVSETPSPRLQAVDPALEREQVKRLAAVRQRRDSREVERCLAQVQRAAADESVNLLPELYRAVSAYATVGEICGVLRTVFGTYRPGRGG